MTTVDPKALHRRWVHSREEDTPTQKVFRPAGYDFPLSRGRESFELQPDGGLLNFGLSPDDRQNFVAGRWNLEPGDKLVFHVPSKSQDARTMKTQDAKTMQIEVLNEDRLVIRKA